SLGSLDTLLRINDFFEINDTNTVVYGNTEESVKGMAHWRSDKPIMLVQYAYSSPWDEDHNWDPVMLQVPPLSQFVQSAVFIAQQSYDTYKTHMLTLFIDKSSLYEGESSLERVYFDGEPLSSLNTIATPVRGTNIDYLRIEVQPGAHRIESIGKIAGYITGAGKFNAYAYPMTTGLNRTTLPDSAKPTTEIESYDCGDYVIDAQEKVTNFEDHSLQYDSGLMKIFLIEDKSNNYELKIFKEEDFPGYGRIIQRMFNLNVLDKTQDAHASVAILDRAGNYSIHEYDYFVEELETSVEELVFGKVIIGETKELELILTNAGDQPLQIISVHFEDIDCFAFKDEIQVWPSIIEPGNSMTFTIVYEPETPSTCFNTVMITTECAQFKVPVSAYAYPVFPDIHFGKVELETKECKTFELINIQDDPITVDSVRVSGVFTLPVYQLPEPPFDIPAGEIIEFKSICFTPTDTILYEGEVTIYSNAKFNEELVLKVDGIGEDLSSVYEEDNSNLIFTISPNPATAGKAELLINESINSNLNITLFDATGNSVINIADNSFEKSFDIPLNNISSGVYFVRVRIGDMIYSKKLIVKK
ncbi:MAG: T9SS type A sorting domain-containing protein, partial [Chlorobi bacterium]|nr:T9SS type A sorting domain-containing protein [Chlorobiota bacterium]